MKVTINHAHQPTYPLTIGEVHPGVLFEAQHDAIGMVVAMSPGPEAYRVIWLTHNFNTSGHFGYDNMATVKATKCRLFTGQITLENQAQ